MSKHIAIAGNIGSGKTTLTEMLAQHYGWEPHFEEVDQNPYLNDFYEDMQRWSFNLQIYFLNSRYRQNREMFAKDHNTVQDRTICEDAHIFAPNLHAMGLMSSRDFDNYTRLFEAMSSHLQKPDLLIYLRATVPTLVRQSKGEAEILRIIFDWITSNALTNVTKHGSRDIPMASCSLFLWIKSTLQISPKILVKSFSKSKQNWGDYFNFSTTPSLPLNPLTFAPKKNGPCFGGKTRWLFRLSKWLLEPKNLLGRRSRLLGGRGLLRGRHFFGRGFHALNSFDSRRFLHHGRLDFVFVHQGWSHHESHHRNEF